MSIRFWNEETRVNATAVAGEAESHVVALTGGRLMIVWLDGTTAIRGRLFEADGTSAGEEFVVATASAGSSFVDVTAAARPDNAAAISWLTFTGGDQSMTIQSLNAIGNPVVPPSTVLFGARFNQEIADLDAAGGTGTLGAVVAFRQAGGFGINYRSVTTGNTYASGGLGGGGQDDNVDIASRGSAGLVAVWEAQGGANDLYAKFLNASGAPVGETFLIYNGVQFADYNPSVAAMTGFGGFAVAYTRSATSAPGQGLDVVVQLFDGAGVAFGAAVQANAYAVGVQDFAQLVPLADGGLLCLWVDDERDLVMAQQFDPFGARLGGNLIVSTDSAVLTDPANDGFVDAISATLLRDGRVAVSWTTTTGGIASVILDPRDGQVQGTTGADVLYGSSLDDQITALAGNDAVFAGRGDDSVLGGGGNDSLRGEAGEDELFGQSGFDTLFGGAGADLLNGGADYDEASYSTATAAIKLNLVTGAHTGDAQGDAFVSVEGFILTAFNDVFTGDDVARSVNGFDGDDSLTGGTGDDLFFGGQGGDTLRGGNGADDLYGEAGVDFLYGGAGNDELFGGADAGRLYGEAGTDVLTGGSAGDLMYGGQDGDNLLGNGGTDQLFGDEGADFIYGGEAADQLSGGTGADVFFYIEAADSAPTARDRIFDFSQAELDKIDLGSIDAVPGGADNPFVIWTGAFTAPGQLRLTKRATETLVEANLDGDADAEFAVLVSGTQTLTAGDFYL